MARPSLPVQGTPVPGLLALTLGYALGVAAGVASASVALSLGASLVALTLTSIAARVIARARPVAEEQPRESWPPAVVTEVRENTRRPRPSLVPPPENRPHAQRTGEGA